MSGQLFTQYFLRDGIKSTSHWKRSAAEPGAFTAFCETARRILHAYGGAENLNEAVTEQEVVRPLLEALGWRDYLPQQGSSGNEDIPDHLLFADAESKTRAIGQQEPRARFRSALVVQESKRLGLPLDVRDDADRASRNTPHGQILRYLETAHLASEGGIRWGMLTNGVVWRLYDHRARPRASGFYEANLGDLTQPGREDELCAFHLLFRRDAFTPPADAAGTFLEDALAEGRRYEEQVARDLSTVVFERVFPRLVRALAEAADDVPEPSATKRLSEVRRAALIFLYRLLFVLYAEDRGLLPVNDSRYDDYGLRKRVRDDVARRMADGDRFSSRASQYDDHLRNLFRLIDAGDPSIGLPPYNGGLFARGAAPLLETVRLPDDAVAAVVYDLSHRGTDGEHRFVNYRDMSVQQLGSIYERLLEHEPARGADGTITIRPNPYVRKDSGSFYTPQELVDLILDHTLKPLAEERLKAFEDKAAALHSDSRPKAERRAELSGLDPAEAVLELKV
ncbi:MAG: type I restriction enzyme HsdR N-terminal domain-containing protein, partial [Candidatus Tectomicrobia bacterium]|nr:type I restriction enzyme HsdR N-terminal domain-containing protein [Candidatus Tectomicrobia bacterium]